MSVETAPASFPQPENPHTGVPNPAERPYDPATDPYLRNDPETDVAVPLPEEFYTRPDLLESAPQTDEDFAARWGQMEGTWAKIKAGVGAAAGRVRAFRKGEEYDATKHNRVVQNEMYKDIGDVAVREHLFAHDTKRFDRYATGKRRHVEIAGAALREAGLIGAFIGMSAIYGAGRLLEEVTAPGSSASVLGVHMDQKAQKVMKHIDTAATTPTAASERASAVHRTLRKAHQQAQMKAVIAR